MADISAPPIRINRQHWMSLIKLVLHSRDLHAAIDGRAAAGKYLLLASSYSDFKVFRCH